MASLLEPCSSAGTRQIVDLAYPHRGVSEVKVDWGAAYGNPIAFVGDIDGDGFDDLLLREPFSELGPNYTVLIYGQADAPATLDYDALRKTRFRNGDPETGIYPHDDTPYAAAGDVDGDGYDDFLVGAPMARPNEVDRGGSVLLLFGAPHFPTEVDLEAPESSGLRVQRFLPEGPVFGTGVSMATVGDVNADGLIDLCIGAPGAPRETGGNPGAGRVYTVFGGWDPAVPELLLENVGHGLPGFVVRGITETNEPIEHGDSLGYAIAAAQDVNGDGFDDFLTAAPVRHSEHGEVYIVFGGASLAPDLDLAKAGPSHVTLKGPPGNGRFGSALAGPADMNGDGFDDVVVGAFHSYELQGSAFLVFGRSPWESELSLSEGAPQSLELSGAPTSVPRYIAGELGQTAVPVGDWNADGYPDCIVTAPREIDGFEPYIGHAYLLFGGPSFPVKSGADQIGLELPGIVFRGRRSLYNLGMQATGGDFNGDGRSDLVLTSPFFQPCFCSPDELSSIYIILGGTSDADLIVNSVEPDSCSTSGGLEIHIRGSGFDEGASVSFGAVPATDIRVASSAEIIVRAPPQLAPGNVDLQVNVGARSATAAAAFHYTDRNGFEDIILDDELLQQQHRSLIVGGSTEFQSVARNFRDFINTQLGDLNADGKDDLLIGSPFDGQNEQGTLSILLGSNTLPERIRREELADFATVIEGEDGFQHLGYFFALPGDVTGDGRPDLVLSGAIEAGGGRRLARAYLIPGVEDWPRGTFSLSDMLVSGDATLLEQHSCGIMPVAGPGDLTGDGVPEVILGNTNCPGGLGSLRLYSTTVFPEPEPLLEVFGDPTSMPDPLDPTGPTTQRVFAAGLSSAGDVNADGVPDLLVGAQHLIGEAFLIFHVPVDTPSSNINELVQSKAALPVRRNARYGNLGGSLGAAGDVNGDGVDDVLIGVPSGGRSFEGEAFLVFGSRTLESNEELDLLSPGPWRVRMKGEFAYDWNASTVAGLGDLDGDGYDDVGIVGGDLWNYASRAYVVFGEPNLPEELRLSNLGSHGFRILGSSDEEWFSAGLQGGISAGDLDGDGARDIAIGERAPDGYRVVVIFGGKGVKTFIRGDADGDGRLSLTDPIRILGSLFLGGPALSCEEAADVDDSGALQITDAIALLGYLFLGAPAPPAPFPNRGADPTADLLECNS
jgi:hypothetical protein